MRLRIKECLKDYNEANNSSMNLRELAKKTIGEYHSHGSSDATKYKRLSSINTGVKEATATELMALCEVLDCDCSDLIEQNQQP